LGGLKFEASLGKLFERTPISKITKPKWNGDIAKVVE
jgi:hypothetical protein